MSPEVPTRDDGPGRSVVLEAELSKTRLGRKLLDARAAAETAPPAAPTGSRAAPRLPETDAAILAAISHTFSLGQATGGTSAIEQITPSSRDEADAILANSVALMIGGRRRLRLTPQARADLLQRVLHSDRCRDLLAQAAKDDARDFKLISKDQIRLPTAWLRSFLQKKHGTLDQAPPSELRGAMEALEQLRELKSEGLSLPPLGEVRRLLELSELLEPLRILIGVTGGWDGTPRRDRFVGRSREIAQLRGFVDELEHETVVEAVSRFLTRAYKGAQYYFGVREESVMFVQAQGGLGKSTLMAKFMIDHACNQSSPFPFVYLDFDRSVLHPREPRQLLLEAARQVALQFPVIEDELRRLMQRLSGQATKPSTGTPSNPFDEFCSVLQSRVTRKSRAFLVVLDTMEIVQYDPKALAGVITFVSELSGQARGADFPELKIVASGRADVPDLRTRPDIRSSNRHLLLKPLDVEEARDMANRIGQDLLEREWRTEWATLIAGRGSDPSERREPLAIRVAVELIRAAKPEKRQSLAEDIARDGEAADEGFIGRLYERRVLDHVQDPVVQRLAWPGLIVRRVTKDIIREKLADLCGIKRSQTDAVFASLANEVWMVEELEQGRVLRHRSDLRARTLPLMQNRDRSLFAEVNEAARDYFFERRTSAENYAEWLYHRLLGGEEPEVVDWDWQDDMTRLLAGAAEDFRRGSPARDYLLARTTDHLLPGELIARLSPRLALDHVARTGQQLGVFDDVQIEPILADLSARLAAGVTSSQPHPVSGIILVKTGRWGVDASLEGGEGDWAAHAAFARRFKRARSLAGATRPPGEPAVSSIFPAQEPEGIHLVLRTGMARALIQDLAAARVIRSDRAQGLDHTIEKLLSARVESLVSADVSALRTAIVFGDACSAAAVQAWLTLQRRLSMQGPPTISLAELRALVTPADASAGRLPAELASELRRLASQMASLLTPPAPNQRQQVIRIADPAIHEVVMRSIDRMLAEDSARHMPTIRRFFAARDEDWIVPFGYAVARALPGGTLPKSLSERLASYEPPRFRVLGGTIGGRADLPSDCLEIVRRADEASDLLEFVRSVLGDSNDTDLRLLLKHYTGWRRHIEHILETDDTKSSA